MPAIDKTNPLQAVLCTFLMMEWLLGSMGVRDRSTCKASAGTSYRIDVASSRVARIPRI